MTPYQNHEMLGHNMTRSSPNGVDIIEECSTPNCGARFLHNPAVGHPITLSPNLAGRLEWGEQVKKNAQPSEVRT
jgi:hypothetical protein